MSCDREDTRGFLPPTGTTSTDDLHRRPSSCTGTPNGNNLPPTSYVSSPTKTTPEAQLAAALGRAIFAVNTHNPLLQNVSDPTTTTTPPKFFLEPASDIIFAGTPTGKNLPSFTALTPSPTSYVSSPTKTTPESHLAAALGRAIFTVNTHNLLRQNVSDPTTTTTPFFPERNPIRRAASAPILTEYQERHNTKTPPRVPVPRTVSPSSIRKVSPEWKKLTKMEEMVREIEQKCREFMVQSEAAKQHVEDDNPSQAVVEQEEVKEECVGLERLDDGGLRIQLSCSCGKGFEILLKDNGCFYRLA